MSVHKLFASKYNGEKYAGSFTYQEARDYLNSLEKSERESASLVFVGLDFFVRKADK